MKSPQINTSTRVVPMCYGYSTPEIARHNGWTKIGYTEKDVDERIYEQTHTADVEYKKEWQGQATYDDGTGDAFTDHHFHAYLKKNNIEQMPDKDNEWFHVDGPSSYKMFNEFRQNRGITKTADVAIEYKLRKEQSDAVNKTLSYMEKHPDGEFLWNCKPRFGKTLAVYDLLKHLNGVMKVLIVTNRPAVAASWFDDYKKFLGSDSNYLFVSSVDILKNTPGVLSRDEYLQAISGKDKKACIQFVSLQDLKGSLYAGGQYDKLKKEFSLKWDILVVDEAHEAVDTFKTNIAFSKIDRKFTLHLSGTPFKALASAKFRDDAVFSWTYADEQQAKESWKSDTGEANPYFDLPRINLYTYQMSEVIKEEIAKGIDIDGENYDYAFNLNEFFATNGSGRFLYNSSVDKFLDALTLNKKYPFSTEELRDEIKHSFWLLNRVDSARALSRKLKNHPVFKDYHVILAAGDGRINIEEEIEQSYIQVKNAIKKYDKTITLSVGQLTTGVTVPEWSAVLMLSEVKSPALYMQAAFRAQNPCLYGGGCSFARKTNAYIFDFNPARTLIKYEEFANDLYSDTAGGRGDTKTRRGRIKTLLNFFPVIGEDDNGELVSLDENKVLLIPRKIKSVEVVKRGFMSNFLFQNIDRVFGAPREVLQAIENMQVPKKSDAKLNMPDDVATELSLDENGEICISDEQAQNVASELFGENVYEIEDPINYFVQSKDGNRSDKRQASQDLKEAISSTSVQQIIEKVRKSENYDLRPMDYKRMESDIKKKSDFMVNKVTKEHEIDANILQKDYKNALQNRHESGKSTDEIDKEFAKKSEVLSNEFKNNLTTAVNDFIKNTEIDAVRNAETVTKERKKRCHEDDVKDHLRGFARTIPSFLMAYGDEVDCVTLANFDTIVPDDVFLEVTSITLDQFRFLRDGGNYTDADTGENKHFDGEIFDEIVFNDSVVEFMDLRKRLSDYFDKDSKQDIFDYIPPQKTNQIFTPKRVVKKMVDLLEQENPGCYDDSSKTFIDLYMKSGLYIAEIVKRLFNSPVLIKEFPDEKDRLIHIFEHQVYGCAPSEIIYRIATNFILGFKPDYMNIKHNFKLLDTLPYAKEGTLEQKLDEVYEGNK